jgi:hypothetical protein
MEEQKKPVSLLGKIGRLDCCSDMHLLAELKHLVKLKVMPLQQQALSMLTG